ncbi:SIR2 family protein [Akkermansia sp.]|uniref:SIR2 family protein n=1 Tax=Akkermansia sp. TaxID=1872421 RepID=UPI0025CD284E|nr:SIR2 family protein [Akkermansia sp.]MEE0765667.1 SIR2 family protein [Akkermansia sp.]
MRSLSAMMREKLKKQLEQFTPQNHPESILHALADLQADDYLTTNYDTFLRRILELRGYEQKSSQHSETKYSIRRHACMENKEHSHSCRIWNIHGTYNDKPDSFTIQYGYEHYCGCIGKIDNYLKGTYTYQLHKKEVSVPRMYKKLQDYKLRKGESWIDAFFFSNIHILGLNLSPEEIDLLYILNLRSRWLRDPKIKNRIRNRIVFYGQPTNAVKALLEQFSVEVRSSSPEPPCENAKNEAYEDYYKRVLKDIKSEMGQSGN